MLTVLTLLAVEKELAGAGSAGSALGASWVRAPRMRCTSSPRSARMPSMFSISPNQHLNNPSRDHQLVQHGDRITLDIATVRKLNSLCMNMINFFLQKFVS